MRWLGGEWAGDGDAVGDGGDGEVEVYGRWVSRVVGGGCTGRRETPDASAQCADQSVTTDYRVQLAVARLCYHREKVENNGG